MPVCIFSNYINLTSAILISLTSIAFIQNKEPKIKIPKYFRLNNITIFVLLSSAWFFYPLFYNYIHIPTSNTIFTYSLFLLPLIFNFYKKNTNLSNYIICIFFIVNQALFISHTNEINRNSNKSKSIIEAIYPIKSQKSVVIEDYENQKYFSRYSNKFSTLKNMLVYNFPKDTVPKIILSSQVQKEKVRDYVVVKLSEGKIFVTDTLSGIKPKDYDFFFD